MQTEPQSVLAPNEVQERSFLRKLRPSLFVLLAAIATFLFAAYPIYVIRPFREQQPAPLSHALWVLLHYRPIVLLVTLAIAACVLWLWRSAGWVSRTLLGMAVAVTLVAVAATWINPYEQMFHPMGDPRFISAAEASIDPNDMVLVVTMNDQSRAYPIREMGYHHIVNDRLNGLPIVVTY